MSLPWYGTAQNASTCAVANAGTVVTIAGTNLVTDGGSDPGFVGQGWVGPDGNTYEITAVTSTTFTLRYPYRGTTVASAGVYSVMPMQGFQRDAAYKLAQMANAPKTYSPTLSAAKSLVAAGIVLPNGFGVIAGGRSTVNDNYGGAFIYKDSDTTTTFRQDADGFVDNQGRRFFRQTGPSRDIRHAGADGTSDDTNAIVATAQNCDDAGGGVVFVPPGPTFLVSSELPVFNNVYYVGEGSGISKLKAKNTFGTTSNLIGAWNVAKSGWGVIGLDINGNADARSWSTDDQWGNNIMIGSGCSNVTISDVSSRNSMMNALVCYLSNFVTIDKLNATALGKGYAGMVAPGTGAPGAWSHCGLQLAASNFVTMTRSFISGSQQYCVWLQNNGGVVQVVNIDNCDMYGAFSDGAFIGDNASNNPLLRCSLTRSRIAGNGVLANGTPSAAGGVGVRFSVGTGTTFYIDEFDFKNNRLWDNMTMNLLIDSANTRRAQVIGNRFMNTLTGTYGAGPTTKGAYGIREFSEKSQFYHNRAEGNQTANYDFHGTNRSDDATNV